jgi:hypothetical protein
LLSDVTTIIEYGTSPGLRAPDDPPRSVPVVVIGAGRAAAIALTKLLVRT